MTHAYICDAIRTPIGRYGGVLSAVRADDLAALPIQALMRRNPKVDWAAVADVIYGCANQAGEDNRNVARIYTDLAVIDVTASGLAVREMAEGLDLAALQELTGAPLARAALPTASMPEPQRRLMVAPGTVCGRPASSADMRATLRLSSPAWLAQP